MTSDQAMGGVVPWELRSVEELEEASAEGSKSSAFRESGEETPQARRDERAEGRRGEPQPGFETARALAYADGRLALWDLHAKKPAAVASFEEPGRERRRLLCGARPGSGTGGGVIATGTTMARRGFGSCRAREARLGQGGTPSPSRACARSTRAPARAPTSACLRLCAPAVRARAPRAARWQAGWPLATARAGRASPGARIPTETPDPPSSACWRAWAAKSRARPTPPCWCPLELDSALARRVPADAREAARRPCRTLGRSRPWHWLRLHSGRRRRRRRRRSRRAGRSTSTTRERSCGQRRRRGPPAVFLRSASEHRRRRRGVSWSRETEPTQAREPLPAEEIVELMPRLAAVRGGDGGEPRRRSAVRGRARDAAGTEPFRCRGAGRVGGRLASDRRRGGRRRPVVQGGASPFRGT